MIKSILFGLAITLLVVTGLLPLLFLISKVDAQDYLLVLQHPAAFRAASNTVLLGSAVALLSLLFGVPLAWLVTRTDLPERDRWRSRLSLPYVIPPYVGAIGWIFLANPSSGLLNALIGFPLFNIYSFWGLVWVETSFLFTFTLLTCLASLDRMDASLEEAARLSGANGLRVFWDIGLPLLKPAIGSAILLSFLATAASFGVPAMIGGPARIFLITTQIYTYQKMGTQTGLQQAVALSAVLMFFAVALLVLNSWWLRNKNYGIVSGKSSRPSLLTLGRWQTPVRILLWCFWFAVFLLPILGLGISALSRTQGVLAWSSFTFDNFYRVLFSTEETARAVAHSLGLGVLTATLACVVGLILAFISTKTNYRWRKWIDAIAAIPYSTPGTVVALAMILSFSHGIFGFGPSLYNTFTLILIAYFAKYLSLSVKTLSDGYGQIDDTLVEAARVAGANWWQSFRTILIPLLRPALLAGWFLIFVPVVSELTMTQLLTGPGLETLGTLIFQLQEYSDIGGGGAAVLSLLIVFLVLSLNFVVKKVSDGKYGL